LPRDAVDLERSSGAVPKKGGSAASRGGEGKGSSQREYRKTNLTTLFSFPTQAKLDDGGRKESASGATGDGVLKTFRRTGDNRHGEGTPADAGGEELARRRAR